MHIHFQNFKIMKIQFLILFVFILLSCNSTKSSDDKTVKPTDASNTLAAKAKAVNNDMIVIKGGSFIMGNDNGTANEKPAHKVTVADFKMDIQPVTVEQFSKFIKETAYVTDAERFGDAGVFNFDTQSWELKKGANWRKPLGADTPNAESNHPVTQVSWNDANAYCQWVKKRLPTEAEWEYAARNGGKSKTLYSWGNELMINGKYKANVWQGEDINATQGEDGYKLTSPVGSFGRNEIGLADMGGNVWNWCSDTFGLYPGSSQNYNVDPNTKCMRGGSFFFDPALEKSYTVSFRAPNTAETSLFNIGFRCAAKP